MFLISHSGKVISIVGIHCRTHNVPRVFLDMRFLRVKERTVNGGGVVGGWVGGGGGGWV